MMCLARMLALLGYQKFQLPSDPLSTGPFRGGPFNALVVSFSF